MTISQFANSFDRRPKAPGERNKGVQRAYRELKRDEAAERQVEYDKTNPPAARPCPGRKLREGLL